MKLVFVSNILNHHQMEFCACLQEAFGEFVFVATQNVETLGFQKAQEAEYVYHYYLPEERGKCESAIMEADAVIFGDSPIKLLKMRMKENKLSFVYAERLFKKGLWRRWHPNIQKCVRMQFLENLEKEMYVLCASAYLSYDLSLFGHPEGKCLKWGYFPQFEQYEAETLAQYRANNEKMKLLWAGRMIDWKHPDDAVYVAEQLKKSGYDFELHMIGSGEMEAELREYVRKKELIDCVIMHGAQTPQEVRAYMRCADVFLFTSDFNEGWGAVLNEAMNSGCAVVASHAAGSAPYLLREGENGALYKSGNRKMLLRKVKELLDDKKKREQYSKCAYHTIESQWNAAVAAQRLREIVDALLLKKSVQGVFEDGPCSKAVISKNNWF